MAITSAMFDTPKLANQSVNINHIASQGKGSLLDGMGADTQANTVTSTYGITGNQSAKVSAGQSAKFYANQSPKFTGNQSGEYFSGYKSADILRYSNLSHSKGGEITPFKGFMAVTTRGEIEFCQPINDRRVEFSESIKKGSVSTTRFIQLSDCLILRCLRLISAFAAVTKKRAVLSPSLLSCSIKFKSSSGSLTETCSDLLFFLPVAIPETSSNRWCSVCTRKLNFQMLTWCSPLTILVVFTLCCSGGTNSETPQWWNTNGASNHSDNASIEVAMSKHITPVTGRNSITPSQSFRWLFLALERGNPAAKPHRIEATAPNEHSARLLLVRDYILAFAGRLPVREVAA